MSFLSGSPRQQPGVMSGSNGYGQHSSGHLQLQQQQHKPAVGAQECEWHCRGQAALGGQSPADKTLTEDEARGRNRTEVASPGAVSGAPASQSFRMPALKIEEVSNRGRLREDGHRAEGTGGLLGSAGQSPSSPSSSHSSPSSSLSTPSVSPGRVETPTQSHTQRNDLLKDGLFIQGHQVHTAMHPPPPKQHAQELEERNTSKPSLIVGSTQPTDNKNNHPKCESPLGSLADQTSESPSRKETVDSERADAPPPPAADLPGGKAAANAPPTAGSLPAGKTGAESSKKDGDQSELHVKNGKVVPCSTENKDIKSIPTSEVPQRTTVRRTMSDCSHLSVPMLMAETYPTVVGGSPAQMANVPNFTLMGSACPPRAPYPHVAVRRSFTLMDSTEAAAAMSMMSSQLMTSPVLPSSPPPRRHHDSCETNFLLPVPPPAGPFISPSQDGKVGTVVKADNKDKPEKIDVTPAKTEKTDTFDKKDKVEPQKKDDGPDKNQKSDKILIKDEEKTKTINTEKDKANEKVEKVDKPEKTNKDEKKKEEETKVVEKGGKGAAKSPTNNNAKMSPESKSKSPENGLAKKRPPVPKATPTPRAATNKNDSAAPSANKAPANKNDKAKTKTGDIKKPKSTARPRPASSTTPATPAASTNGDTNTTQRRRIITKPPVPKQVPIEKKPPAPRTNRTPYPSNAPTPDLKNVRSKIGSTDNIKYQPGGGKVSSNQNNKTSDPSAPATKARVQIVHKKLDFSHITSRCGSKDNIKHVPGGGNVQILNKKIDVSRVTSKCGSKDNIKYKPGGGDVKIESHKMNIKAKSKVGSMDNVNPGDVQTNGHKDEKAEQKTSSPTNGAPATSPAGVAKATAPGGVAKENGVKESAPAPFGGDGLSVNKHITQTN